MSRICFYLFIVLFIFEKCQPKGIEMIPERVEVPFVNTKQLTNVSVAVRRKSRGGQYVVNVAAHNTNLWANNVTISINFYEFLHNEYRPSFVRMTYKFCDWTNLNPYGRITQQYGIVCPLPPRNWELNNATITIPHFPYVFPFTKGKAEVVFQRIPTEELIVRAFLYITIKQM